MRAGDAMNHGLSSGSPSPMISRPRFAPILAGLMILMLGLTAAVAAEIEIGGPFTLTDQNGQTRSDKDFRGSYMLIYFGYASCPDACPTALTKMTDALALIAGRDAGKAARVAPIFITVDPERDTPELLKDYAAYFTPRLVALSGDAEALRTAAYAYGVFFAKAPAGDGNYLMNHTEFIYVMAPDGRYITHFESDVTAEQLAAALEAEAAAHPHMNSSH